MDREEEGPSATCQKRPREDVRGGRVGKLVSYGCCCYVCFQLSIYISWFSSSTALISWSIGLNQLPRYSHNLAQPQHTLQYGKLHYYVICHSDNVLVFSLWGCVRISSDVDTPCLPHVDVAWFSSSVSSEGRAIREGAGPLVLSVTLRIHWLSLLVLNSCEETNEASNCLSSLFSLISLNMWHLAPGSWGTQNVCV